MLLAGGSALHVSAAENSDMRIEVAQLPTVRVVGSHVEITVHGDETKTVSIYSLTGQLVRTIKAEPGVTTVTLAAGYYIVRCDRLSQRVIVR